MRRGRFLRRTTRAASVAVFLCGSAASLASDSSVELSVGGLAFGAEQEISVESEDVRITPQLVTVRYRLLNNGARPVTLRLNFPLPDIDMSDPDLLYAIPGNDPVNFVGFQTKADGKPLKFEIRQRAFLGDKDITEALRGAGLPLLPMGTQTEAVDALTQEARDRLVAQGILVPAGNDQSGKTLYSGPWTVKTSATGEQALAPGQAVVLDHSYRASVGISFDTVLRKAVRESQAMQAEFKRYLAEYCIPEGLLRGIDRVAGSTPANIVKLQERRISYRLKPASDARPVKDFRVVIDKGRADNLVSFCLDNVKKISATTFEFRAKDFTPERDLKILLITRLEGKVPVSRPDAPLLKQPTGRPERFE
ncbi:MAG TPA: DUF4424 family protein [Xanthobacteraceae bacterium]|nr:DUF4424 family protein [Xanthobacteraceae bacterium]